MERTSVGCVVLGPYNTPRIPTPRGMVRSLCTIYDSCKTSESLVGTDLQGAPIDGGRDGPRRKAHGEDSPWLTSCGRGLGPGDGPLGATRQVPRSECSS